MYWGQLAVAIAGGVAVVAWLQMRGHGAVVLIAGAVLAYLGIRWTIAWLARVRYWVRRGGRRRARCPDCGQRIRRLGGDWIMTCRRCDWRAGWPLMRWFTRSVPARQLVRTVSGPSLLVAVVAGALLIGLFVPAVPAVVSEDGDEVTRAIQTLHTALFDERTEPNEDASGDDDGAGPAPSDETGDEADGAQEDREPPPESDGDTGANEADIPPVEGDVDEDVTDDEQVPEGTTDGEADGSSDADQDDGPNRGDDGADDDGSSDDPNDGEEPNGETGGDDEDVDQGEIDPDVVEAMIFSLFNELRGDEGMADLEWNEQAHTAASGHAADMAEQDYFSHTSLDGETAQERYGFCVGGENIAQTWIHRNVRTADGTKRITTNEELAVNVVQIWMNSDPHRERGIYGSWTSGAAAIEITEDGKVYAVFGFCR